MKEREIAPGAVRFKRREIAPGAVRIKGAQRRRCSANAGRARDCGGRLGRLPRAENGCWARDHLVGARERGGGGRTRSGVAGDGRSGVAGDGRSGAGDHKEGGARALTARGRAARRARHPRRRGSKQSLRRYPSRSGGADTSESRRSRVILSLPLSHSESLRVTRQAQGGGRWPGPQKAPRRRPASLDPGPGRPGPSALPAPPSWAAGCRTCLPSLASPSESSLGPVRFRAAAPPARPCRWMPDPSAPSPPTKSCGIPYQVKRRHCHRNTAPGCLPPGAVPVWWPGTVRAEPDRDRMDRDRARTVTVQGP